MVVLPGDSCAKEDLAQLINAPNPGPSFWEINGKRFSCQTGFESLVAIGAIPA
jgi:hypothetical protein